MKTILFLAILALIIACTPVIQEEEPTENITELVLENITEEVSEPIEEIEPVSEPEAEELEEIQEEPEGVAEAPEEELAETNETEEVKTKIEEMLPKFAQGVKSYSFIYGLNNYYVRGSKMKIVPKDFVYERNVDVEGKTYSYVYLDVIYLDKDEKRAVGYCEGLTTQVRDYCVKYEIEDLKFPRLYADYIITLPEDWLFEFLNKIPHSVEENKYMIMDRITTLVKFIAADKTTELYFDERIGLPIRVLIKQGEVVIEKHDYEYLVVNHVREVDVIHRSRSEIPSEEAFYAN